MDRALKEGKRSLERCRRCEVEGRNPLKYQWKLYGIIKNVKHSIPQTSNV